MILIMNLMGGIVEDKTLEAICFSVSCCGRSTSSTKGIKKEVNGRPIECPDCRSILFWRKPSKTRHKWHATNKWSKDRMTLSRSLRVV